MGLVVAGATDALLDLHANRADSGDRGRSIYTGIKLTM